MAQIHWANDVSGNFGAAADWTGDVAPGKSDDAILDAAGSTKYNVTVSSTGAIHSIQTAATATLLVKVGEGAGGFDASAGSGSGANAGAITVADGGDFIFGGTIDNTGRINLSAAADATELSIAGKGVLSGAGTVKLTDSASNQIAAAAAGATLTNAGNIITGAGSIGGGGLTLVNKAGAKIDATGANALIIATGATTVTNTGTLESTNAAGLTSLGGLELDGETIANVGGIIQASGAATHVDLRSATIVGGILRGVSGGVVDAVDGGSTLNGVAHFLTLQADLAVGDGDALAIDGAMNMVKGFGAEIALNGAASQTQLIVGASGAKLEGRGQVILGDSADNEIDAASAATLTNLDDTIAGAGTIGGGGLILVNDAQGTIDATGTANALVLNTAAKSITNGGLIEATGLGGLVIDSNVRNTTGGKIEVSGGGAVTVNNATITGGTVVVGSGSDLDLSNFNLTGVTLTTQGMGVVIADGGEINTNAALAANILVRYGTNLDLTGLVDNSGVIALITDDNGGENGTQLVLKGSTTFEGGGSIYMGGSTPSANFIDGAANPVKGGVHTGFTLTNVDDTISGAGNLGVGQLGLGWLNIVNDAGGVIDGSGATYQLDLSTGGNSTVINAGLLEGTGAAGLEINAAVANTGTILAAAGGAVNMTAAVIYGGGVETSATGAINIVDRASFVNLASLVNGGVISLQDASLQLTGDITLAGGGQIVLAGAAPTSNRVLGDGGAVALTNVDNTLSGAGLVGAGISLVNDAAGVIDADISGDGITLDTDSGGSLSIINLGLIESSAGGYIALSGTEIVNTGGTLDAGSASSFNLNGAAGIYGGVLKSGAGGVFNIQGRAAFTSLETDGTVDINDGDTLYLGGVIDNTGTLALAANDQGAGLDITGAVSLTGGGRVTMGGAAPGNDAINDDSGAPGGVLTNVDNTISGGGVIGVSGSITFINGAGGLVDANSKLANITFVSAAYTSIINQGLIEATGAGGVTLQGVQLTNTGGTILAATGSTVTLNNYANVYEGVIKSTGTGVFDINGGASFDDITTSAVVDVLDGDRLFFADTIANTGTIVLNGAGDGAELSIAGAVTLTGAGRILIGGSGGPANDAIDGNPFGSGAVLTNDSTIIGEGHVGGDGGAGVAIVNGAAGVIDGTGDVLGIVLDNTGASITNQGLIEAQAGGLTTIDTFVNNTGTIEANGGDVIVNAGAAGAGKLMVAAGGTLEVATGGMAEAVTFASTGGVLRLDASQSFTGAVTAFSKTGATSFDLRDIGFIGAGEAAFVENAAKTSGVLTVTDGTHTASITLVGNFSADTFTASSDGAGGTDVVAMPTSASPARLAAAMAALPPAGASHVAATLVTQAHPHPILASHG